MILANITIQNTKTGWNRTLSYGDAGLIRDILHCRILRNNRDIEMLSKMELNIEANKSMAVLQQENNRIRDILFLFDMKE